MYAQSWDDIVTLMTAHVRERHPDIAKQMEEMHNEDPEKWNREMKPKWDATPEEQAA
jgi:hypothetical protein